MDIFSRFFTKVQCIAVPYWVSIKLMTIIMLRNGLLRKSTFTWQYGSSKQFDRMRCSSWAISKSLPTGKRFRILIWSWCTKVVGTFQKSHKISMNTRLLRGCFDLPHCAFNTKFKTVLEFWSTYRTLKIDWAIFRNWNFHKSLLNTLYGFQGFV